jgi:hypothetical protein
VLRVEYERKISILELSKTVRALNLPNEIYDIINVRGYAGFLLFKSVYLSLEYSRYNIRISISHLSMHNLTVDTAVKKKSVG